MSIRLMTRVFESKIKASAERFVAVVIGDHCGDDGKGWVGVTRIAAFTGLSRATVRRAIRELEKGGWLVTRTNAGGYRTNLYELRLEGGLTVTGAQSDRGSERGGGGAHSEGGEGLTVRGEGAHSEPQSIHIRPEPVRTPLGGGVPSPPVGQSLALPSQVSSAGEKKQRRDWPFEALAEIDGAKFGAMSKVEAGRIGQALQTIRQVWPSNTPRPEEPAKGVQGPEREKWLADLEAYRAAREIDDPVLGNEIKRRAKRWASDVFPNAKCTSSALAAHWSKCAPPGGTVPAGCVPNSGGRFPLPIGCDFHAVGHEVGLRIPFDVPWSEVCSESKAKILEAYHAKQLVT
jgi:hypothetical protein